jgi:hypothetical protein
LFDLFECRYSRFIKRAVCCNFFFLSSKVNLTHASEKHYLKNVNNFKIIARFPLFGHVYELCIDIGISDFWRRDVNLGMRISKVKIKRSLCRPEQALGAERG